MRLSEHCYTRDLRCFSVALRMLRHDARTRTITAWTGFSAERVRKLLRSQRRESGPRLARRQRGPSPTQLEGVLTSDTLKSEAAAAAGVCRMLEVVPPERRPKVRGTLGIIAQGEQVLGAYELFQDIIPHPRLTLEQWLLLLHRLADATEWAIARCRCCLAVIVVDRLALACALCEDCQHEGRSKKATAARKAGKARAVSSRTAGISVPQQLGLFEDEN